MSGENKDLAIANGEALMRMRNRAERAEDQLDHMKKAIGEERDRLRSWDSKAVTATQAHEETADRLDSILKGVEG